MFFQEFHIHTYGDIGIFFLDIHNSYIWELHIHTYDIIDIYMTIDWLKR